MISTFFDVNPNSLINADDVIGVSVFLRKLMRFLRMEKVNSVPTPLLGLYSKGQFNGRFFSATILGGLYLEGLINGGAFGNFTVL